MKLVISDAHEGLKAAIRRVFSAGWQRCRVHWMRNALGYVSISLFLFAIWALTFLLYDRRMATIFSRGKVRVRTVIGGGETSFDTLGIRVEKHTDDIFRHWLLGFGSGDLTVKTSGTNAAQFEIPNVLFINRKLKLIQRMLLEREVVGGKA